MTTVVDLPIHEQLVRDLTGWPVVDPDSGEPGVAGGPHPARIPSTRRTEPVRGVQHPRSQEMITTTDPHDEQPSISAMPTTKDFADSARVQIARGWTQCLVEVRLAGFAGEVGESGKTDTEVVYDLGEVTGRRQDSHGIAVCSFEGDLLATPTAPRELPRPGEPGRLGPAVPLGVDL